MLVLIRHENACKKRFDVFCQGKKLKSGEEYPLPQGEIRLLFIERNPLMSRFWLLRAFALFLAGLLSGNFGDFKEVPRTRKQTEVRLFGVGDDLEITFLEGGYSIFGAEKQEEVSSDAVSLPQVERRIRIYIAVTAGIGVVALAAVILGLIFALL